MRNWIKSIILECLKEVVKDEPLIIAHRPPSDDDVYYEGTIWRFTPYMGKRESYVAKKVTVQWERIE